jgi:hypothetical protein
MAMIHINRAGSSLGTFSEEDVREGLRSGRFAPTDLGWREGMASWQPLSQFSEFGGTAPPAGVPAITPETASVGAPAPRSGLPWDRRQERGFFPAFFETLMMVLTKPHLAFTAMKREGGLVDPLIYALVGGSFGLIVYLLLMLMMPSIAVLGGGGENPLANAIGAGVSSVVAIIFVPLFLAVLMFIGSAIVHVCLMIVGGAKQSFETTFRVMCFSTGSAYPLIIVPVCGGFISGVWGLVVECIGLSRAHETDVGRAVLALLLPLIICCGLGTLFFGGIGALMNWSQ